jgi:hypothetical protein
MRNATTIRCEEDSVPHSFRSAPLSLLVLLAGCALAPAQHGGMTPADVSCVANAACSIPVTIEVKGVDCFIVCNPRTAEVANIEDSAKIRADKIVWTLPADVRARFVSGGIEFDDPKAPFRCAADSDGNGASNDRKQWTCTNSGSRGRWKYNVRLKNDDSLSLPLDPFVVNH